MTLTLAVLTGTLVGTLAWREGGRPRLACVPLGLLGSTIPLSASGQASAGTYLPYIFLWAVGVGVIVAVWTGVMVWHAEGRWREFALPLAFLGLALPLVAFGYGLVGVAGVFVGALYAWVIGCGYVLLAATWLLLSGGGADRARAGAWGATTVFAPGLPLYLYIGNGVGAALCVLGILVFWVGDYMSRTRGPWDDIDGWIEAKTARIFLAGGAAGVAYPASMVLMLRESDYGFVRSVMHRALPLGQLPPGAIAVFAFSVCLTVMLGLHQHLPASKQRAHVYATACVPLLGWAVVGPSLPVDLGTAGVIFSLLVMLVTCLGVLIKANPRAVSR